jgi:hypothetical protein
MNWGYSPRSSRGRVRGVDRHFDGGYSRTGGGDMDDLDLARRTQRGGGSRFVDKFDSGAGEWRVQGPGKRQRQNTGGDFDSKASALDEFKVLSVDEKLNFMMTKLFKLDVVSENLERVEVTVRENANDIKEMQSDLRDYECRLKTIEYRALDQEARGRRQNLIFWGFDESEGEDCESIVIKCAREQLDIGEEIVIQRAHRVGRPRGVGFKSSKPRPLIACFRDFKDADMIISKAIKLRGSSMGVSRDYPQEINAARKYLWPEYKRLKKDNENVSIRFPAKLCVNHVIVDDCFPNWDHFLRRKYSEPDTYDSNKNAYDSRQKGSVSAENSRRSLFSASGTSVKDRDIGVTQDKSNANSDVTQIEIPTTRNGLAATGVCDNVDESSIDVSSEKFVKSASTSENTGERVDNTECKSNNSKSKNSEAGNHGDGDLSDETHLNKTDADRDKTDGKIKK